MHRARVSPGSYQYSQQAGAGTVSQKRAGADRGRGAGDTPSGIRIQYGYFPSHGYRRTGAAAGYDEDRDPGDGGKALCPGKDTDGLSGKEKPDIGGGFFQDGTA